MPVLLIRGPHWDPPGLGKSDLSNLKQQRLLLTWTNAGQRRGSDHCGSAISWRYFHTGFHNLGTFVHCLLGFLCCCWEIWCHLDFLFLSLTILYYNYFLFLLRSLQNHDYHRSEISWWHAFNVALLIHWPWHLVDAFVLNMYAFLFWQIFLNYFFDIFIPFISSVHSFWDSYLSANWT